MRRRKMAGKIAIHRNANDCGKDSLMSITITGTTGETIKGEVANGCTEVFDVEGSEYNVFVELGVRSPTQTITVRSTTITLHASVIPKAGKIGIDRIDLQ
jgi:small ligand-binding sensory domain FIST